MKVLTGRFDFKMLFTVFDFFFWDDDFFRLSDSVWISSSTVTEGQGFSILVSGFSSATSNGFCAFIFLVFSDFAANSLYLLWARSSFNLSISTCFSRISFCCSRIFWSLDSSFSFCFSIFSFFGIVVPSFFQLRGVLLQVIPGVRFSCLKVNVIKKI